MPLAHGIVTASVLEIPAQRGPLDADEREVARRLGEHLRDALLAHQRVRSLMQQAPAGHGLLNSFPHPMWLIGEDRHIGLRNPAAARELEQGTRVAQRGANLALLRSAQDRQLSERLHTLYRADHAASAVVDLRARSAAWTPSRWPICSA